MNKANTTATVPTVINRRARAQAIAAAQANGKFIAAPISPAVIILPPFMPSNTAVFEEVLNTARRAAYISIRARHQSSGLNFLKTLNDMQPADLMRDNIPAIAAEALAARAAHAEYRARVDFYDAIANRVSADIAQREHAAQLVEDYRKKAKEAHDTYERLERVISTTSYSDRADIVQAAALAYWQTGNFKLACSAAGRAIAAVAAANGCKSVSTKVRPISKEEAAALRKDYAASTMRVYKDGVWHTVENTDTVRIPFNHRDGSAAGYTTIERRNSKRYPDGLYEVKHYVTAAPYISYEVFATDEDAPALAKNDGINAIESQQAAEDLAALFNRAKLSERERVILYNIMDNTAAAAGIKAVAEYQQQTAAKVKKYRDRANEEYTAAALAGVDGDSDSAWYAETAARYDLKAAQEAQRDADKRLDDIRRKAMISNAMTRAGIYSDTNQRKALERIRAKLEAAQSAPADLTAADLAERDRRMWERLHGNRDRYSRDTSAADSSAPIMPTLTVYSGKDTRPAALRKYGYEYATMEIQFVQTVNPADLHTLTAAERAADDARRAAALAAPLADAARLDYRRTMRDHQPTRTAYAAHDAICSAFVFFDRMTRAEQMRHIAPIVAQEAAEALQKAAAAKAMFDKAIGEKAAGLAQAARDAHAHADKLVSIAAAVAKAAQE